MDESLVKIGLVTCVYPPEPIISAQTSAQIAEALHQQGGELTVLTAFPNRPGGQLYPGFTKRLFAQNNLSASFHLIRCWNVFSPSASMLSRLLENLSFGLTSSLKLLFLPRPQVIYANTWPVFAQGLACLAARLRRVPIVLSIQDIYPESLLAQGRLHPHSGLYKLLRWLDRANARSVRALIVISEQFAKIYREDRCIPAEKIHVIPNWVDPDEIQLLPKMQFRSKMDLPADALVFGYAGNIGVAAGVEQVIQAFAQVSDERAYLLIAGDGSRRKACQELVERLGAKNIAIHSPWLAEETSEVLAAADVLLLPTQGEQSLSSVPSKMLNYMLAARPILTAVHPDSDTAKVIYKTGCGWVVQTESPEQLARKIEEIIAVSEDQLGQMGQAGREYALNNFISDRCLPKVIEIIESAGIQDL